MIGRLQDIAAASFQLHRTRLPAGLASTTLQYTNSCADVRHPRPQMDIHRPTHSLCLLHYYTRPNLTRPWALTGPSFINSQETHQCIFLLSASFLPYLPSSCSPSRDPPFHILQPLSPPFSAACGRGEREATSGPPPGRVVVPFCLRWPSWPRMRGERAGLCSGV